MTKKLAKSVSYEVRRSILLLFVLCSFYVFPARAQDTIIKTFAHQERKEGFLYPICFYPSTLRMINVAQDPNFYDLVNDIDKVLIYNLDSASAPNNFTGWLKEYEAIGYEEYITIYGAQYFRVLGKANEYVGIANASRNMVAFYIKGEIPLGKLPELIQSFSSADLLSVITDQFNE